MLSPFEFRIDFIFFGITVTKEDKINSENQNKRKQKKERIRFNSLRNALMTLDRFSVLSLKVPSEETVNSEFSGDAVGVWNAGAGILYSLLYTVFRDVRTLQEERTVLRLQTRLFPLLISFFPLLSERIFRHVGKSNE